MTDPIQCSHVPPTEFSRQFVRGMLDRVVVGHHRYGTVRDAFRDGVDFLASARKRIEMYRQTGNTEWLMDAANNLMYESMYPSVEGAELRPTTEDESPGRVLESGRVDRGQGR